MAETRVGHDLTTSRHYTTSKYSSKYRMMLWTENKIAVESRNFLQYIKLLQNAGASLNHSIEMLIACTIHCIE